MIPRRTPMATACVRSVAVLRALILPNLFLASTSSQASLPNWQKPAITSFRLQVDDSAAHADCYCLSAIIGAQLAQDVLEMNLDGFLSDKQGFCDIPIPVAGCDVTENLHFTSAEIFVAHVFCKSGSNLWRNALLTGVDSANGVNHLLRGHAL